MSSFVTDHPDVVVAGAGPTGLTLACELALAGVKVLVLERRTGVDATIKAGAINSPSAEAYYRRGLLPALAEIQREALGRFGSFAARARETGAGDPRPAPRFAGHFAALPLDGRLLDASDPEFGDPGPAAAVGLVPQERLERLLEARASELGAEIRRGVEIEGFDADEDGVTVRTGAGPVRTGWLVGCDGGRSTVRKAAGFDFPGTDPEITGRQALVEMEGAEALGAGWRTTETGHYVHGPMPGRILTVEFDGPPADRESPVTAEELEDSLRRVAGVDVTVTAVRSATRFTDNARQATAYRKGRVLLAGDAAHVHSPFGGQGLNLGVGDAMNLGWKLAATVRGDAPEALLDTYTAERYPIGAWVLEWTRAQIAVMRPGPHARAMRAVVGELMGTVEGTTYFVKKVSGVWQGYDLPGDHPLTGRSAPDLAFADGTRLGEHLHHGRALLLDLRDDPALRAAADGYAGRVDVVTARCPDRQEPAALLVRPDGFVAWAADAGTEGLGGALRLWFGEPVVS
ncbi:FAD-dependent oxidoreductase [Streptomyces sp. AV19]|uniref:FAD-dependent oxidoreductase n=1 Tax=Streptomyces sp. AV19 TaxID=2793068 RepID=UPI0018FEAB83|nr:FAD-dependent oxidoreductase [Streptomyces sp. AV19]MBH1936741.1 FAD-dependent oxidoreductase [Streptomyces sp. AV19]MDG4532800.1 FAD-dependent oxidoreductase [Streptomyces sp. AV19]